MVHAADDNLDAGLGLERIAKDSTSMRSWSEMVKERPAFAPWFGGMEIISMLISSSAMRSNTSAIKPVVAGLPCRVTSVILLTVLISVVP